MKFGVYLGWESWITSRFLKDRRMLQGEGIVSERGQENMRTERCCG